MPGPLYALLPYTVDFVPYTGSHVVSQLQLLLFSGLAFFLMLGWLQRTLTITLDIDWLYRRLGASCSGNSTGGFSVLERTCRAAARSARVVSNGRTAIMGRTASWPALGRPAAWPSGPPSCWPLIWLLSYL